MKFAVSTDTYLRLRLSDWVEIGFFGISETEAPIGIRKVKVCVDLAFEEVLGPLGIVVEEEDELPPWAPPPQAARDNDVIIAREVIVFFTFNFSFFP